MPPFDVARRWKGRVVLDQAGDKLGHVLDVLYDAETDEPGWALLGTATGGDGAGGGTRLVPVADAVEDGNELRVPYDRAFVESAPGMDPGGRLWPQEEAELYAYYGLPYTGASLVDLDEDEEDDAARARVRGFPPRSARTPASGS